MSKLSKLLGKSKVFVIGGQELEFKPLTMDNVGLLMDLEDNNKRSNAMKEILRITLKNADPDATDEEIKQIGIQYFKQLSEAIMEVNGLNEPKSKS